MILVFGLYTVNLGIVSKQLTQVTSKSLYYWPSNTTWMTSVSIGFELVPILFWYFLMIYVAWAVWCVLYVCGKREVLKFIVNLQGTFCQVVAKYFKSWFLFFMFPCTIVGTYPHSVIFYEAWPWSDNWNNFHVCTHLVCPPTQIMFKAMVQDVFIL